MVGYISVVETHCPTWESDDLVSAVAAATTSTPTSASPTPNSKAARDGNGDGVGEISMGPVQSTMRRVGDEEEEKEAVRDEDKTAFDFVKEDAVDRLSVLFQLKMTTNPDATDEEGMALLHWAADRGSIRCLRFLLERGANPSLGDDDALTPLHYAAMCDRPQIVKILLAAGASPSAVDSDGATPRDMADSPELRALLPRRTLV